MLLGTFAMAPGQGHKVSLTDQANGYVIADAIQLLDVASPEFNTATWAPNSPAGQYEVYAKWTANPNRATNATYTITHAQGITQVPVNQQLNGSTFNLLGTFNLNNSSTITLSDQANGFVIADAVQLIALTTVPKMYFVHTDHLNTPRLITNDTGQTMWRWDNDDPYGNNAPNENPAGAGQFTCNLRLPGQYFDSELNTHYNYFRDYDPATGRYVQSDPIGLTGGLNTYTYVENSPLSKNDRFGRCAGDDLICQSAVGQTNIPTTGVGYFPSGFQWYGNWGGPGWTGGNWSTWNNLTATQKTNVRQPIDPQDECYMQHDICFGKCRSSNNCPTNDAALCFRDCDRKLSACLNNLAAKMPWNNWRSKAASWYFSRSNPKATD